MKTKKTVSLMVATTLIAPAFATAAKPTKGAVQVQKMTGEQIALDQSTTTLLSLLIATNKVELMAGKLVAVDPEVAKKYTYLRTAYLGGIPTSSVTSGAGFLGAQSISDVKFILKPLTLVLRALQVMGRYSLEGLEKFLIATGLDKALEKSFDSSEKSIDVVWGNIIEPILKLFITENTFLASAASGASASAAGSIFFMMKDSKEAMTTDQVRHLLGQDKIINSRIEAAVRGIAEIYNLNADQQSQLKNAIYDDIIRQAAINKFSDDSSLYKLDVVKLMADKKIVDRATAQSAMAIRQAVQKLTSSSESNLNTKELVAQNTDMALQLAALLESQLTSNNIKDPAARAEIERMLGSVSAKLALIGFNLKK